MSSSPPSVAATATALALTTPFVAPPGCPIFSTTTVDVSSGSIDGVATVLVGDNPSCLPKGWGDVVRESRAMFDPGVCPSGWVYHDMANGDATYKFTAFCCPRCGSSSFASLTPLTRCTNADNRVQRLRLWHL